MYEELVKNLRICSRCDFGQDCNGCTHKSDDAIYGFCCDKLLHEAAEAIEELSISVERLKSATNMVFVGDKLPEESGDYIVYSVGGTWNQISSIDIIFFNGKRFVTSSFQRPIYWMPLPEPPKDGEE